jgi:hypothetical protein
VTHPRALLLPLITALLLASAVLSFFAGRTGLLYGALALIWLALAVLFARPRASVPRVWIIVALLAIASGALVLTLPGLAPTFRLARIGMLAAFAFFLCTMEFAPRGRINAWVGLACAAFAFIVAAWFVESPLAFALAEQSIGRFVQTMYRDGAGANAATGLLLSPTFRPYFVERGGRIYARAATYDVMHAMRMDDPAHIAAIAQGAPPSTNMCSFIADPPSNGYIGRGYARFQQQISAQCR